MHFSLAHTKQVFVNAGANLANLREYVYKGWVRGAIDKMFAQHERNTIAMDAKSLKGIAVVCIEEGEKIGTVDNILFDLERRRVIAFKLIKPNLLRSGGIVAKMSDIESIGKDAIMVKNKDRIRELKAERDLQGRPDLDSISSLRVVSENGTYVGNMDTIQFDKTNGVITDIEVTGGGFMGRLRRNLVIPANEIVSIGSDVVVIPDKYAPVTESDDEDKSDKEETEDRNPAQIEANSASTRAEDENDRIIR
ncbi:MAG: hypothetical protein EA415_00490 [Sphaerobacteraceae bacterium]|nr:MAG: hypothetical protein EA415_00490 [Sphaerobacteraceae bacterium]